MPSGSVRPAGDGERVSLSSRLADVVAQMNEHGHSAFLVYKDFVPLGVITERDAISVLSESFSGKSYEEVLAAAVSTSPVHTLPEFSTTGEVNHFSSLCRTPLTGAYLSSPSESGSTLKL